MVKLVWVIKAWKNRVHLHSPEMASLIVGPSIRIQFPHAVLAVLFYRAVWRKAGMKVLIQLQVQYFSKIKFSCRLRSMGALYVESKCFYIGVGECSQTAEISLIAGWSWVRYHQRHFFFLPACTSSLSYILNTFSSLEYLTAVNRRLDCRFCVAVSFATKRFAFEVSTSYGLGK